MEGLELGESYLSNVWTFEAFFEAFEVIYFNLANESIFMNYKQRHIFGDIYLFVALQFLSVIPLNKMEWTNSQLISTMFDKCVTSFDYVGMTIQIK